MGFRFQRKDFSLPLSARGEADLKIEQKLFLLRMNPKRKLLCITERTRNASFILEIDIAGAQWICANIKEFISKTPSGRLFNKLRTQSGMITIQKFNNSRGSFLELAHFNAQGRKQLIIVPSGKNLWGWRRMVDILIRMAAGTLQGNQRQQINQGLVNGKHAFAHNKANNSRRTSVLGEMNFSEIKRQFAGKNWHEALIITKNLVTTSWELVRKVLGNNINRRIDIFPFQANKAVWWPSNKAEFTNFLNLKRCFFEERVTLNFQEWSPDINSKELTSECCNSWIRIFGLSWDLWSADNFKIIGDECGGLLDICKDTTCLRDLAAVKIKVRGLRGGFINNKLNVQLKEGSAEISIVVDSIDLSAYEILERQSYAQAVINGKRTMVGWGNSNIRKSAGKQVDPNRIVTPADAAVEYRPIHTSFSEDKVKGKGLDIIEPLMTEFKGSASSKEAEQEKASDCLGSAKSLSGKGIKILQRIVPKKLNAFEKSPIHSMDEQDTAKSNSKETSQGTTIGCLGSAIPARTFEMKYSRRKNMKQNMGRDWLIPSSADVIGTWKQQDKQPGDACLEDADLDSLFGLEDDVYSEDCDSLNSDSLVSVHSDASAPLEDATVDLKGLFESSLDSSNLKRSFRQENATPIGGGKILSSYVSSFLNHSFKLNSLLPASFSVLGGGGVGIGGDDLNSDDVESDNKKTISYGSELGKRIQYEGLSEGGGFRGTNVLL